MKKTIAKLLFIVVCIGGIIFLLLPFLETTPPATTHFNTTQPQISSDNPLAAIARRLKSLFARRVPEQRAELPAGKPAPLPSYTPPAFGKDTRAALNFSSQELLPTQVNAATNMPNTLTAEVQVPPVSDNEYANAALLTDNGEWVLVQQTIPPSATPGMHEVNVHEDPYTRYLKQERARRVEVAARPAEIPDSKWARLWRPVQYFLGLPGSRPVENSPLALRRQWQTAPRGNATTGVDRARNITQSGRRMRLPWPDITPQQWAQMTPQERANEWQQRENADFVDVLSGTRAAEDAAEITANAQYPDPKDEGKKESLRRRLSEENKQKIKEGLLSAMRENAQGKQKVDELAEIMAGCTNASLPKAGCSADPAQDPSTPGQEASLFSADEILAQQEKNAQKFLETTRYNMPKDLPLLLVMGPTTPEAIAEMGGATEDVEKTIDLGRFLYDRQNCANQTCFWIPNTIQHDKSLSEAVRMANAKPVTDPDNTYPGFLNDFKQYKKEQAQNQQPAGNTAPAPTDKDLEKQFTDNAPGWIPITEEQLKNIHQRYTVEPVRSRGSASRKEVIVIYGTNPVYAEDIYHAIGDHVTFAYAKQPLTAAQADPNGLSPQQADKQTVVQTAELIEESLAENFNTALAEVRDVTQQAVKQATQTGLSRAVNQRGNNSQNGATMSQQIQNRNSRTPNGKK